MRSGSAARAARGYTYIAMLVAVAVVSAGLAATGEVWSHAHKREKEQELLFIGNQFRQAIAFYYEQTPGGAKHYPATLEDLLEDKRYPYPRRYLRKLYADPITGKPEWGLMQAPGGGIMGVYSLSNAEPVKKAEFGARNRVFHEATNYYEWRFFYEPPPIAAVPAP
jgi:type II secretory pathway pseudopilin PulG